MKLSEDGSTLTTSGVKSALIVAPNGTINIRVADGFFSRLKGLLWSKPLLAGEGLLLSPCNSVHTVGMAYPIDIIFLNESYRILEIVMDCSAMRMASNKNAKYTLELAAGQAKALGLEQRMGLTLN